MTKKQTFLLILKTSVSRLISIQNEKQRLESCWQLPKKKNIHYRKFLDTQHDGIQHNDTLHNQLKHFIWRKNIFINF